MRFLISDVDKDVLFLQTKFNNHVAKKLLTPKDKRSFIIILILIQLSGFQDIAKKSRVAAVVPFSSNYVIFRWLLAKISFTSEEDSVAVRVAN